MSTRMNEIWLKFKIDFIDPDPTVTYHELMLYRSVFFAGAQSTIMALRDITNANPCDSLESIRNRMEEQHSLAKEITNVCIECIKESNASDVIKLVKNYDASRN